MTVSSSRRYRHHTLKCGEFFQCFIRQPRQDPSVLTPSPIGEGELTVWLLRKILKDGTGRLWAIGTEGTQVAEELESSNLFTFPDDRSAHTCLIHMTEVVRKAFGVHACDIDPGCSIHPSTKLITHTLPHSQCTHFRVIMRKDGYPPRRA